MPRLFNSLWSRLLACFLAGLFAILPLVVTVAIVIWVARFVESLLGPGTTVGRQVQSVGSRFVTDYTLAYLIGWSVVLAAIFLLGMLTRAGLQRWLDRLADKVVRRIPVARTIYSTTSQIISMLRKTDEADLKKMSVVYCQFGEARGGGLLALLPTPHKHHLNGRDFYAVYVPTSPVPMTGGLVLVPVESVTPVKMKVEALMSFYLSMGVSSPRMLGGEERLLAAKE